MTDIDYGYVPPLDIIDGEGATWTRKHPSAGRISIALTADRLAALAAFERSRGDETYAIIFDTFRRDLEAGKRVAWIDPVPVTIHGTDGLDATGRQWVLLCPAPGQVAHPLSGAEFGYLATGYSEAARDHFEANQEAPGLACADRAAALRVLAQAAASEPVIPPHALSNPGSA